MNLELHLKPETEAKLKQRASLAGKHVEEVVIEALEEQLNGEPVSAPTIPTDAWLREFDDWVSGHRSRNPDLDDSRESNYSDRW